MHMHAPSSPPPHPLPPSVWASAVRREARREFGERAWRRRRVQTNFFGGFCRLPHCTLKGWLCVCVEAGCVSWCIRTSPSLHLLSPLRVLSPSPLPSPLELSIRSFLCFACWASAGRACLLLLHPAAVSFPHELGGKSKFYLGFLPCKRMCFITRLKDRVKFGKILTAVL